MIIGKETVFKCKCNRCNYVWTSKKTSVEDIKVCPSCHNPYWNTKKIKKTKKS